MRHRLYKFYDDRQWGEAFLDGELLFRSLSYFCDYEETETRGDVNEGTSIFRPAGGLLINNHTQGRVTLLEGGFESTVNEQEIFIFCLSRSANQKLFLNFKAVVYVEILDAGKFCARIQAALPSGTTFLGKPGRTHIGQPVQYYKETDSCNPRWALPDLIAVSKLSKYSWQDEFRLVFSTTDALDFEKVDLRLLRGNVSPRETQKHSESRKYLVNAGSLRDICRLHDLRSRAEILSQS
jgi:hypothetical protein